MAAVGGHLTDSLSVVGEVGGNYKSVTIEGVDVRLSVHTFLGGVRFASRSNPKTVPFGQVLVGVARAGGSTDVFGTTVSNSQNAFAFQPGAGVDVLISGNTGIRIQGDYRLVRSNGANGSEFRIAAGVVFYVGK